MRKGIGSALWIYLLATTTCGFAADYEPIAKRTRRACAVTALKLEQGRAEQKRDCDEIGDEELLEGQEVAQELLERGMKFIEEDKALGWLDVRLTLADNSALMRPIDCRILSWVDAAPVTYVGGVGEIMRPQQAENHKTSPYPEDEEDADLVFLYLRFRLMNLGIKQQRNDFLRIKCRGCGDPRIPYAFFLPFDFNNQVDTSGHSFMTRAVACNDGETVWLLLHYGASINRPDARNVTPLEEAYYRSKERMEYVRMIELLRACGAMERFSSVDGRR